MRTAERTVVPVAPSVTLVLPRCTRSRQLPVSKRFHQSARRCSRRSSSPETRKFLNQFRPGADGGWGMIPFCINHSSINW